MNTTLPTHDEALAAASDRPAFSTSDEGLAWMGRWCDRCAHDRSARAGDGTGCPLVGAAMLGRTPAQWEEVKGGQGTAFGRFRCSLFTLDQG